jgi:hypothetical protein
MTLSQYLILPVQRIPRVKIYLKKKYSLLIRVKILFKKRNYLEIQTKTRTSTKI